MRVPEAIQKNMITLPFLVEKWIKCGSETATTTTPYPEIPQVGSERVGLEHKAASYPYLIKIERLIPMDPWLK